MAVDRYVKSQAGKTIINHPPPPELIEISLFDRFGWSPEDVDNIEYGRLQRIMVAMKQMERSEESLTNRSSQPGVNTGERTGRSGKKHK
jgi:predicted AAA+ superfamily ATPase